MEGHEVHSQGRGNVLSPRVPAAPGMAAQGLGWLHSGGDGQTRPEVMGVTRSVGLMSRRCPAWVLTVYFGTPNMFITLWFGFDYGTNPPLGTLII
jgi:hypothetical protein